MGEHPAALLGLGLIVGFVGSLVGVGGGFFMVPWFTLALGWCNLAAVGTSLGVITANATSGAIGFARQKRVDFLIGSVLGLSTLPGTWLGKVAAEHVGSSAFKVAFGVLVA